MQSPLAALLEEIKHSVALPHGRATDEAAGAAWHAAERNPLLSDVLAILLQPGVQGCVADEQHVASCKQRGTAAFGRGQHRQAAALFSEALRYCDEGASMAGKQLAAKLYCNRALCLMRLQPPALEAAVQDSSCAIACDPGFAKAWYRRALAVQALGHTSSALADARHALQLLQEQGSHDTSQAAALVAELEAAVAAAEQGGVSVAALAGDAAAGAAADRGAGEASNGDGAAQAAVVNGQADRSEVAAAAGAGSLHGLLAQAGQRLQVIQTEAAGRCLVAAQELPAGCEVLRERPFAYALTKRGRRSVCATCLAPLEGVPAPCYCRRCPMLQYCSDACRAADAFHTPGGPECQRPWPVLLPPEAVAALRLAWRLHEAAGSDALAARQLAALGTHFGELPAEDVAELAGLAVVAHATWQQAVAETGGLQGEHQQQAARPSGGEGGGQQQEQVLVGLHSSSSNSSITAGDVLEALCRLQVNGLAVVPAERYGSQDRLGLAIYPVGSLMNHSCQPNVATRFEGGMLCVRTVEAVAPGEPLLHCYGPQAGEMTTAQRQLMLQQQYFFTCRCRACTAAGEQAALADAASAGLRCPASRSRSSGSGSQGTVAAASANGHVPCEGAVLPPVAVAPGLLHQYGLPPGEGSCCACGARLSAEQWREQVLPDVQAAAEAHAAAAEVLEQQERQGAGVAGPAAAQQAIRLLRHSLRLRQQHLHPHNLLLGSVHDALAHAWQLAGNAQAAAQHLRHSLTVLNHAYSPGSTAAAFQQRELARMLRLAAADAAPASSATAVEQLLAEARAAEEAADSVLELHFGTGAGVA